jgi:quercetin dioxygenase-like cupin family protein
MKDDFISEALNLNKLIDYQEDSVVSRSLIKKKTGNVTLFAFDQGQALSEHTAPFDAMAYILDGEAEITISGKTFHLNTGEMIIMPANEPHALKAVKKYKMLLIMVKS